MAQAASVVPSIGPVLHPSRTRLRCYGGAVTAVAAATLVRWLLQPWLGTDAPFSIHYGAIIFAAWYGGLGPGVVSTLLGAAAVHLLLGDQLGGPVNGAGDVLWTLLFVATGVLTSYLSEALHVARCRIDHAATELRAGLAEVEKARREVEEASRVKDEFLATLSHELRTPLTAILGWAHLLQTGRAQDRLDTGLETIARNARQQAELIDGVLDLSRIVTGKLHLETRPVQPVEPVVAAIQAVLPTIRAKGIALRQDLDPDAGPVAGDRDRLQQVVWNLLANAVKFTPQGGNVEVRLAERGGAVEIAVADSGEGIPAEDLPHVFERFWQRDSSSRRRHGGLGMGLAMVRHLVELHGGAVGVASGGAERGATFTVTLPRVAGAAERPGTAALPAREAEAAAPAAPAPDLGGAAVLVVDDDADTRDIVRLQLESRGARVTTAASVPEALAALERQRFAVVVADLGLPGQDGYDLIRQLRALPPERGGGTPAAALSAYTRDSDRERALASGFQLHLPKPIDQQRLAAAVAELREAGAAKEVAAPGDR